jgi:hypothetical protein
MTTDTEPDGKDVFILGAGFSASIGTRMPVMAELTKLVL